MRMPLILAGAALVVATPLVAQQMAIPGTTDVSRVTAGTYKTDPGHTLIGWRVNHLGFNDYFGIFGDADGTLVLDPKQPAAAKLDITIPVGKLTTASAGLTKHMMSKDFFNAEVTPTARFTSTAVKVNGTRAAITGNLTLNGVTKPVVLNARFTGAGANPMSKKETIGFEADAVLKRSDFNMNYGIPAVSDEVELDITVAFEKA
ncbi:MULTISPECIES: YceI family protein [Sphingomonas]|uniref:YceI family protein n=1 Tax=Sphingomonas TaxID=13687 RepID=UPI0019CFCF9C|nr:YceI family protein [Sphingomonas sp. ABOLF]GLK21121.1 protein YceI [Microbacterium terregens]